MTSTESTQAFTVLDTAAQLEELIAESSVRPVLIFKHSPTCGTSAQAYDSLEMFLQSPGALDVNVVDVLRSRPLSQAIAAKFGVRHESPQVLLLVDGQVLWSGSHWRVNAGDVQKAILSAATSRGTSPAHT